MNELSKLLRETGLIHDHRRFFDLFAPGIVEDWGALEMLFSGKNQEMLEAIQVVLCCDPPSVPDPELNLRQYYGMVDNTLFNFQGFALCWNAIYITHLFRSGLDTNKAIMDAVALYRKPPRSLNLLLMDYVAQLPGGELSLPPQTSRKPMVERGLTEAEKAEEKILKRLFKQLPTDVIRGVFYRENRDDSAFECAYILREFKKTLSVESHVLIVNPSPDFLLCWAEQVSDIGPCFAVADETIARMYRYQFPNFMFTSHPEGEFTNTLIMSRDSEGTPSHIPKARENSILMAVHPQNDRASLMDAMDQGGYFVRRILGIPTQATCSTPKRKMVVFAEGVRKDQYFQLQFAYCDPKGEILSTQKQYDLVPYQKLYSTLTLADMRKSARNTGKTAAKSSQQEASAYQFSAEISLHYSIQPNKRNRVEGRACYRRIPRSEDKHLKMGARLTKLTSRGLRKKTEDEVVAALEDVPLYDNFSNLIIEDVLDFCSGNLHQLSLKTAWFCLREELSNRITYKEELAKQLFCAENQQLSNLPICASAEEIEKVVQVVLGEDAPQKLWQQLNMIFAAAVDAGWIKRNPLCNLMLGIDAKTRKRQQEVSNALTKKTLEDREEWAIVDYVRARNEQTGLRRYQEDGSWLVGLIRLFTGMRLREVCALRWEDFVEIPNMGVYQLSVSKYLTDQGTVKRTIDRELEQHRCVPVAPMLTEILLDYKMHLMNTYNLSSEQLSICPIIPHKPDALKQGMSTKFCALAMASRRCRELIDLLNIPAREIILPDPKTGGKRKNLNQYQGDLFYSNFKYRARHRCGFLGGELCYMLGLRASDTYSRHYCDYGHDMLQFRMVHKLQRWTAKFSQNPSPIKSAVNENSVVRGRFSVETKSSDTELVQLICMISSQENEHLDTLTIDVHSRFGAKGNIIVAGG